MGVFWMYIILRMRLRGSDYYNDNPPHADKNQTKRWVCSG